jgi:CheY-like chemotaxis protein
MSSSSPAARTELRVLVVDDHPEVRAMLEDMVRALGIDHVLTAGDGRQALDCVMSQPVDLVITDLAMPVMDGLELTRRLRAHPATARIPVLMVSAEPPDEAQAREAGVSRLLAKPLRLHQLDAALNGVAQA